MTRPSPVRKRSLTDKSTDAEFAACIVRQVRDQFAFAVERLTSYTARVVVEHFEEIEFHGIDRDSPVLRETIREAVLQNLLTTLRDHVSENGGEPDVVARVRVATTREMLVELLTDNRVDE